MSTYMVELLIIYDSPENRYVMDQNIINIQEEYNKKSSAKQIVQELSSQNNKKCQVFKNPSYMVEILGSRRAISNGYVFRLTRLELRHIMRSSPQ